MMPQAPIWRGLSTDFLGNFIFNTEVLNGDFVSGLLNALEIAQILKIVISKEAAITLYFVRAKLTICCDNMEQV